MLGMNFLLVISLFNNNDYWHKILYYVIFFYHIAITYIADVITSLISALLNYLEYYYPQPFSLNDASLK